MAADSDNDLWEQARKGDRAAFAALFDLHAQALYRFAFRLLGSGAGAHADAEDIVQDVLLSILKRGGFSPSRGPLRAYLLGAVRNQARKRRRITDEELSDAIPSDKTTAEHDLLRAEAGETVAAALNALPWAQREVLLLYHYEELSLKDIANALDLELAAVKSRLHRAREALRTKLQSLQGERR